MRWVIATCVLAIAGGCAADGSSPAADDGTHADVAPPEPAPVAEPTRAAAPEQQTSDGESPDAGPLVIDPVEAGDGRLPHDPAIGKVRPTQHATDFGWSADGKSFALCVEGGGPRECTFTFVDGKAETLSSADGSSRLDARLREGGFSKGLLVWRHGRGVTLTWSVPEGKARLEVGARLDSGEHVTDIVWMDFDPEFGDETRIYPEVISISPRGERIAIVGHAVEAKHGHEFKTILLHSDDFAARAYSQAGFDHLSEDRFARAVSAFARATEADPNSWEHAYNLACGRARSGQGNVRRPLTRAIDLGGEKVRAKAQHDSALAGVKRTDWFKAMVAK